MLMKRSKLLLLVVLFLTSCAAPVTPTPTSTPVTPTLATTSTQISIPETKAGFLQTSDAYLGQTPPGDTPVLFAPGIVSKPGRFEHAAIFSRDGTEFYFAETSDWVQLTSYVCKYQNGSWTAATTASFSINRNASEPTISYDNNSLIFTDGYDFWRVMRKGSDWTEPQKLPGVINSPSMQWHPTIAASGNIYFSSGGDIYKSEMVDGSYQKPEMLPEPVNSNYHDADAVIAPDESYIIFNSDRPGGLGGADLYISYLKSDGSWTNPTNLGPTINSDLMDDPSSISPDGKYFFFSRRSDQESDIYWVSSNFIDKFRKTNSNP